MNSNKITLRQAAKEAGISPSLIYHYIQKGLLPKPTHVPNKEKGRGSLAVYDKSIVQNIKRIKNELKTTHSLSKARDRLSITSNNKESFVIKKLEHLLVSAKQKKMDEKSFKNELEELTGFVINPSLASTCYTGEKLQ
jgi:DNA-binding transcriptional MerR regulator